jgi:hypothetical protein
MLPQRARASFASAARRAGCLTKQSQPGKRNAFNVAFTVARIDPREGGGKCGSGVRAVAEPVLGLAGGETRGLQPGYDA